MSPGLAPEGTGGTDGQPEPAAAQSPGAAADLDAPVRAGSALTGGRCPELFFVPLGDAAATVLLSRGDIEAAARTLMR